MSPMTGGRGLARSDFSESFVHAMFRADMSYRRLLTLTDVAKAGYWVRLKCACGHENQQNPMVVYELLARRGANTRLDRLHETLKCGRCGGKDFTAEHCEGPAIWSNGRAAN